MNIRSVGEQGPWTMLDYGDRLFSIGGNLYGPRSTLFQLAVTSACIDVLAQDVSKTPFYLMRRTEFGSEIVRPNEHPAAELLEIEPNPIMGMPEFLALATANLAIDQEYYIAALRAGSNRLLEFVGIPQSKVTKRVNVDAREWFYDIHAGTEHERALFGWAAREGVSQRSVAHIRRRSLNALDVLPTRSLAQTALRLLRSMNEYQDGIFANGGVPKIAFTFPEGLNDDQFERLQKGLERSAEKSQKEGKPILLEGAAGNVPKVEKLSMSTTDADFIKSHINAAMDIIRYFRMPPHKVYLMESIKYDNMDKIERTYVDDTLRPLFSDIAGGCNRVLLTREERRDYFFAFDVEAAYAMNPAERQKIIESRWNNGMIEYDEMRRAIGRNAIGGEPGRARKIVGKFTLLDQDNQPVFEVDAPEAPPAAQDADIKGQVDDPRPEGRTDRRAAR